MEDADTSNRVGEDERNKKTNVIYDCNWTGKQKENVKGIAQ